MAYNLKLYLPSTGAAAVSPAVSSDWEDYNVPSGTYSIAAVTTKINSAMAYRSNNNTATGPSDLEITQWVSDVQAARSWTTSDTFRIQVYIYETSGFTHVYLYAVIRVVSQDGATVRGTLFSGVGSSEAGTSDLVNKSISGAIQNSVSQSTNDRIVVEIGARCTAPNTTSRDVYIRCGDLTANTDAPENDSDTGYDTHNAWVGFTYAAAAATNIVRMII